MPAHRRPVLALLPSALALGLLGGCDAGAGLAPAPPYDGAVYRLGVGDQIRLITYDQEQLSHDFRVGDSGSVTVPLLGPVRAAGLTPEDLGRAIARELEHRNMLRNPSVSVEVVAYRLVTVLGEVTKPGQYAYQPGMTTLTAVGAAGGFTYRADESYAYVIRRTDGPPAEGRLRPQDYVAPGDVVKIPERMF